MSKTVFYVLLGESGSGKDFTASLVGYPVVKFASPYKRQVEKLYDLPVGSLDNRLVKMLRTGLDGERTDGYHKTFLDKLIWQYHKQKEKYEREGLQSFINDRRETTVKEIQFYIQHGLPIMFTDCRNTYEAELIKWFTEADWVDIVIHRLRRTGSSQLSSDKEIDKIWDILISTTDRYIYQVETTDATPEEILEIYKSFEVLH